MHNPSIKGVDGYHGIEPLPSDFEEFWEKRMAEADEIPLIYRIENAMISSPATCKLEEIWFTGMRGSQLHVKYLRPALPQRDLPLVLQFHGYPNTSRSWFDLASFAGMGFALLAYDCPGQGGPGWDTEGYANPTVCGHIVMGLDGDPKDMYFVRNLQNIRVLCRIIRQLPGIDQERVFVNGASQGGALTIDCCALNPDLPRRAAVQFPGFGDFGRSWNTDEMGLGVVNPTFYGVHYYARWYDPTGENRKRYMKKLAYFDTANFSHMVKCEMLFGTGLEDVTVPPITQYAVYNNLRCKKRHLVFPEYKHEEIQEFYDKIIQFFCGEAYR